MPKRKQSAKRKAALRREEAKRGEIMIDDDVEVLQDPTFEPPVNITVESESEIELENQVVTSTLENKEDDHTSGQKRQIKILKCKERCENADIIPERLTKAARTTQWRNVNGKTKKARAIQMQPSIASFFQAKPYLLLFFPLSLSIHLLPSPALPPSLLCSIFTSLTLSQQYSTSVSLHTPRSKANGRCQAPNSPPARDRTWVGLPRKN
ncbi:hypothetical protein BDQ17DRAFT_1547324 [Cyathus striatus]|nr:hypothetical protein BDQ17DRAFT_1547324 [Cyathus striatus]